MKHESGFFEPLLAAFIAGATSYSSNQEIYKALGLALIGGALGWLGKVLMKSLFFYIKGKITGGSKD